MSKKCLLTIVALIMIFVIGIHSKADAAAQWTFMVYLDGDNNLESAAIGDFLEMASVGSDANINIVVQFDRISGYDSTYEDWTTCKRFRITQNMTPIAANAITDLGEVNMGDPATLTSFINWATSTYPATNYALVLWNHGGGWRDQEEALMRALRLAKTGEQKEAIQRELVAIRRPDPLFKAVCWDDTNGGDALYMSEVRSALDAAATNVHLIGFDACLMAMIEVAYETRNTGPTVMVTSEETEPGDGWPYNTILSGLKSNPSWTPTQLGSWIVDKYYESYGNSETQSAVNLTQMATLATAVSNFADAMINNWNTNQAAVKTAAQAVMTAITNARINEKHGSAWPGAHGLAVYFPRTVGEFDANYNGSIIQFPLNTHWEEFLSAFYSSMGGSWISNARAITQEFYYDEHVDLYDFCEKIVNDSPSVWNITPSSDATAMANALLPHGLAMVPGSATYAGGSQASGFFTAPPGILPFDAGIVLTTGDATQIPGPNTGSSDFSYDNGAPGYTPLESLAGNTTYNASVLSFKFIPQTNWVSFQFVFGTDEYNEWVGSQFNDVFAFFLNGKNIALVPGTGAPITVNTVNKSQNSNYYFDNITSPSLNIKLDGLVGIKPGYYLYAAGPVTPGQENTITLAIADTSDGVWDGAVFLKLGSFVQSRRPGMAPVYKLLLQN